jgi:hypothetical protein
MAIQSPVAPAPIRSFARTPLSSFGEMFQRLLYAPAQTRTARSVELFGWLIFLEAPVMILAPHFAASLLHLPPLNEQAANYFRVLGLPIGGLGMLYIASGRLNSEGFAFASLLDRPLVPFVMLLLWKFGFIPGALALMFSVQDTASFLWTLLTWKSERALVPVVAQTNP